jgi:hypothetical protein
MPDRPSADAAAHLSSDPTTLTVPRLFTVAQGEKLCESLQFAAARR